MKQRKNRANLASGVPKSESTRNFTQDTPNQSPVAALGASLVTKQAGRVPQHPCIVLLTLRCIVIIMTRLVLLSYCQCYRSIVIAYVDVILWV